MKIIGIHCPISVDIRVRYMILLTLATVNTIYREKFPFESVSIIICITQRDGIGVPYSKMTFVIRIP